MFQVLKNQSIKTADSLTDEEMMGDFSDQRSEDEYCPCDACVRKKMAARPLKTNPAAAEAPVMMEFDLLKILQLKKSPLPSATPGKEEVVEEGKEVVQKEEGRSLEVVREEEEEVEESYEDINADVILKETILEENEEVEDGSKAEEEEEEEAQCECQCAKDETEENVQEEERETSNDAGEDESADNEEESEQETVKEARRGETANDEEAAEQCDVDEEKGESAGRESAEDENTENKATSEEATERHASEAQEEEDDSREEESQDNARGRGSDEREASKEQTDASQVQEITCMMNLHANFKFELADFLSVFIHSVT